MKQSQSVRLKVTLRRVGIVTTCFLVLTIGMFVVFNLGNKKAAFATANETIATGAFIINMGVTPQTYANGLKPYGLLYDLLVNYKIPVKWVINSSKSRDGIDFTYGGTNYCGGPFIVEPTYINATIAARITYWTGLGVIGVYTTSAITVPVYSTLTVFPKVTVDSLSGREDIIKAYYTNAGIPLTAIKTGDPSTLTGCVDIWTNPHGDPAWATHDDLYQFVTTYKSWIWAECHSVSMLEGCKEAVSPFRQLNFLTSNGLQCYSNGKCEGVNETHGGNSTAPYTYSYPTDPIMQFMGDMHQATDGGSEKWYIPTTTGQWNSNTKQLVNSSDGSGNRKGVVLVYGPAYNNPSNGYVMYTGGHDIDGNGNTAQKVSAQRAYFNFLLTAGISKALQVGATVPTTAFSKQIVDLEGTASSGSGVYTYKWTSQQGAVIAPDNQKSAKYIAPTISATTNDIITFAVTDNCNRTNFVSKPITIQTTLPIKLKYFKATAGDNSVNTDWATSSEINNEYFVIERSKDGVNYNEIGRVEGAGNSTIEKRYSFLDVHPYFNSTSYYRLKQVDYDGQSETFKPVSVHLNDKLNEINALKIYPNPFGETFTAEFESDEERDVEIQVLTLSSVLIFKEMMHLQEGRNTFTYTSPGNLVTGIYLMRIVQDDKVLAVSKVYCRKL